MMKIVLCGSETFYPSILDIASCLMRRGFEVTVPQGAMRPPYVSKERALPESERRDEFSYYYREIHSADAILIVNDTKNGTPGYIGANTLIEMSFAYVLEKMILLINEPPPKEAFPWMDEVHRMRPFYVLTSKVPTEAGFRANEDAAIGDRIWPAVREHKRHLLQQYAFEPLLRIRDVVLNDVRLHCADGRQ